MPNYHVISRERHAQKRWVRYTNYRFAAADSVVPLVAAELSRAVMSLPVAFIEQGTAYVPVAVLGLQNGNNVFVSPDWRWAGHYTPVTFRTYPFLLHNSDDGQQVLCIDEDSGLVTDSASGEAFFGDDGQAAQATLDILNLLVQVEKSRVSTVVACAVLQKYKLIRPWSITVKDDTGEKQIAGLFQIDEAALNQLPADDLWDVRNSGALLMAYCQLLSMQHLPLLGKLTEAQTLSLEKLAPNGNLDLEFLNQDGSFNFESMDWRS